MSVPGERRALGATAAVTTAAGVAVAICARVAGHSAEARAFGALVVSAGAAAVACAALAGYTLWLRRAISRRMGALLRPYLEPRLPNAATPAPVAWSLAPLPLHATLPEPGFALLGPINEN